MTTTIEIRSYSHNGSSWEWNGDGWEAKADNAQAALEAAKSGDFSRYANGETCLLKAFDADGECVGSLEFVPNP